jgi:hypothetical protein
MKLKIFIHSIQIVNEINKIIKRRTISSSNNYSKIVIYYSNFINTIELSLEIIYELFSKDKEIDIYFPLFICELIKLGFKFKEFNNLRNLGYEFYIDKKIFYENILELNEDEYMEKIYNNNFLKENKELSIKPIQGHFYIPIKKKNNTSIFHQFKGKNIILKKDIKCLNINQMGEIIYLLKPVICITILTFYKNNNIIYLFISIILDIIIFFWKIDISDFSFRKKKIFYFENKLKKVNLLFYIVKEPIYSKFIKPIICKIFNFIHLPNLLSSIIIEYLEYYKFLSLIT